MLADPASPTPPPSISLVVDASGSPIHMGIASSDGWEKLEKDNAQAMEGVFQLVEKIFHGDPYSLKNVTKIYYCEGPGSTLGLRLAAAFVKTLLWESEGRITLFQYNALDLAALIPDSPPASLQAPFRRGRRFVRTPSKDSEYVGDKKILDEEAALTEYPDSLHLPDPRGSSLNIPSKSMLSYDLAMLSGLQDLEKISVSTDQPEPYSPEPMIFKKWIPAQVAP
jgi:hypothetical protein